MTKTALLMTVVGLAMLLVMTVAIGQPQQNRNDNRNGNRNSQSRAARRGGGNGQSGQPPAATPTRQRVWINGKEDPELSQRAEKRGATVMVPSERLFKTLGSDVKRERGWVRPGGRQQDKDRNQEWYVVQRGGRELRYQPNERLYYYGGRPHYFTTAPYERDGNLFLALADIAKPSGGTYNYDSQYADNQYSDPYYDNPYYNPPG
ncbi:MAG: copper amine oxidase N-terminal domain-containing protein [Armatimonadetes bacterium]|nr:copper amine oxidase N-terminal domain-containing protein [Armatimonadota bacterium]